MANINIKYKGLTGLLNDLTIDDGQTMAQLRTAIISDEGLDSAYYGRVSIHKNGLVKDSTDFSATTLVNAGIEAGDIITVSADRNQATRQKSQEMTLDIAQLKKQAGGDTTKPYYRSLNTYDITQLPTQYDGNDVVDNANSGGLVVGRPWAVTALFTSLGAEFEIRVDDTTGISPGMIMTGMDYGGATVTVVTVNSSTSLEMSIIAPDTVPAAGTVLTFTNP